MKGFCVATILTLLLPIILYAQNDLVLKNSDKGLYLDHLVEAKQNFYAIGRLYDVNAGDLATFNNLDMTKGLNIGQIIKIPLTKKNFSQASDKKGAPVYYQVVEKDALKSITSNKSTLENIRKWNRLPNDNVPTGSKIIVGYLVGGEFKNIKVKNEVKGDVKKSDVVKTTPEHKDSEIVVTKEDTRPIVQETKKVEPIKENKSFPTEAGYFRSHFDMQTKSYPVSKDLTVTSGIFKTSSGWQDSKYYALIDKVEPGTIIRIINPVNNKTIYAKVLGEMSGIRQNVGLNIRISNAAASALEVNETDKFIVKVNY
jgi:hypothetical protein